MSFFQFFFILRARYKVILASLLVVVLAALGVSLLMSKTYKATASVLINYKGADPVTGLAVPGQLMPGYMATQVDIISSKNVAKQVITDLKLADNQAIYQNFQEATEGKGELADWLADILLNSLDIQPSKESSIIDISFKGANPQFSAIVANAFAEAYLRKNIELKVEPSKKAALYFDEQIKGFREKLQLAQERLSEYQQHKGIVSLDDRMDVERTRLSELSSQVVAAQAQRMEAQSRQRGAVGSGIQDSPDIASNPIIQNLKTEIARAESKFAEISQKYERNHPLYQGSKAEIDNLKAELARQAQSVSANVASNSRILQQRESELQGALAAQKSKLLALNRERDELMMLSREVENAQRVYDVALQRFTNNDIEAQSNQSDVIILNPATAPIKPSSPKVFLNLLIATFVGTLLGIGFALLLELIDRRIRMPEDLYMATKAPVLGVVAKASTKWKVLNSFGGGRPLLK
ncbi:chain length determinant protein EpsF [Methylobacillus sp.]|uniref:chain length determinant protein EpsF n=1 Tax=Methylobacillus sp. TaxID=56818 RepID=UPI002FE0EFF3